ncbi:MAG: multicopper oxidase domain-containing protein [Alphaproteobacteria bacterium]|nr:multicopper oxidase domain-containing protein [Alphaproteobacteria bacterium]
MLALATESLRPYLAGMSLISRLGAALAALVALSPAAAEVRRYEIVVAPERMEVVPGRRDAVVAMNGTVPGPVLRFTEGDVAEVQVTNRLPRPTTIHWHGLLLPGDQDGSAGFNGFEPIAPGATFTYRFPIRQTGTYWYHAHEIDEQAGQYGALIIDPKGADPIVADREAVIVISEHTAEAPGRIVRNLKRDAGRYNFSKRTVGDLIADARKFGLSKTLADRAAWGRMRMDATDIADVTGYALLANGKPTAATPWIEAKPGERLRLRLINGSAMSFVDIRIPGLAMTVVAADGKRVQPVVVDELRMGVAETYDVIVEPTADRAWPLWIETIDRKASVLASLAPRAGMAVEQPASRPRPILMLSEMGHGMDGKAMPAAATAAPVTPPATAAIDPSCPPEHAAMGHCTPKVAAAPAPPPATDPSCPPEHAAMGHCTPRVPAPAATGGVRSGTAVALAAQPEGGTPFPRVDYGFGAMPPMDHSKMDHGPELGREGDTDGSGRVFGWASGAPYGARVLSVRDLASAEPQRDTRPPSREIVVRITGNMERYVWTLDGKKFGEAPPLRVRHGERVRITFVNETMMAHPMHLHGMFFEVENGQPMDRLPSKTVIAVAPGKTQSILLTADEAGEWPLHCHLLYHMDAGMMQRLVVATVDNPDGTPAHSGHRH